MSRRSVPRRGLSLLVGLTALLGYLIYRSANPYCIGAEAAVVPLLLAELLRQGDRVGRIVLWLVTSPLPAQARAEWREDFASALADREDGRGPIDVSLDIALGMPIILWREWGTALPYVMLIDDTLRFSWRRALSLWGLWCLLAAPLLWALHSHIYMYAVAVGVFSTVLIAAPRKSRQADRRRIVLIFAFNLGYVSMVCGPSPLTTATAVALMVGGGMLAIKPTARTAVCTVALPTAAVLAITGLTVAAQPQVTGAAAATCSIAVITAVWMRVNLVMSYGVIESLPSSFVTGAWMTAFLTVGVASDLPWGSQVLQFLQQVFLIACLSGAIAHCVVTMLLHRSAGLTEVLAPRSAEPVP